MPWVRFDDMFTVHRKVDGLSDAAFRLHVSAIFWCARNLTDGFVPEGDLDLVCARVRTPARFAPELVDRGLWLPCPGGWEIKDYLDYQPSKEKVLAEREKSADRQRKWRDNHRNAGSNAVTNGGSNSTPSRPLPKGRRGGAPSARDAPRSDTPNSTTNSPPEEARERARLRALAIANCPTCDHDGYIGTALCDHDPSTRERNARGIALARAALTKPTGRTAS